MFSLDGVDFALTALFAVLLIDQVQKSKDIVPPLIGVVTAAAAMLLVPSQYILITALAAGTAVLMLAKGRNLCR